MIIDWPRPLVDNQGQIKPAFTGAKVSVQSEPYWRGYVIQLAVRRHGSSSLTRFHASQPCSCPLRFSPSGKADDPEVFLPTPTVCSRYSIHRFYGSHSFCASGSPFKRCRMPFPLPGIVMYTYFWLLSSGKGYLLASASGTASCLDLLTGKVLHRWVSRGWFYQIKPTFYPDLISFFDHEMFAIRYDDGRKKH